MKKTKNIHFRISDTLYEQLSKKSLENDTSISNLAREILDLAMVEGDVKSNTVNKEYLKEENPLKDSQFVFLILWMYNQRNPLFPISSTTNLELIQFLKNTLDYYIVKMDPLMKVLFSNVKIDLDRIMEKSSEQVDIDIKFSSIFENNYFDFNLFEKLLVNP